MPPSRLESNEQDGGYGVAALPKRVKFGRYYVDLPRLLTKSRLALMYGDNRLVPGWKTHAVTDAVRDEMASALRGGHVDMGKLSGVDRAHMGHILGHTRANVRVKNGGGDENLDPKERLKVLLGEIDAGNDSTVLRAQLRTLLAYLERRQLMPAKALSDIRRHFL